MMYVFSEPVKNEAEADRIAEAYFQGKADEAEQTEDNE